jgi:hypothetical protein
VFGVRGLDGVLDGVSTASSSERIVLSIESLDPVATAPGTDTASEESGAKPPHSKDSAP